MNHKAVILTKVAGNITQLVGVGMFISSFFVEDNKKAVKRRWKSLVVVAAGYAVFKTDSIVKLVSK